MASKKQYDIGSKLRQSSVHGSGFPHREICIFLIYIDRYIDTSHICIYKNGNTYIFHSYIYEKVGFFLNKIV